MRQALELALEALEEAWYHVGTFQPTEKAIDLYDEARTAIKEALAQPEQRAQLLFEVDGEMLTASQMMGIELFNFQQATGCDTAAEFLAQPEQEPVAWMSEHRFDELRQGFTVMTTLTKQRAFDDDVALYTTPPQRTWVGLTRDEVMECLDQVYGVNVRFGAFAEVIEAKLKEKNT